MRNHFLSVFIYGIALAGFISPTLDPANATAQLRGVEAAALPILHQLKRSLPASTQRLVNCPSINSISSPEGADGLACEFRAVNRHATVRGSAAVARSEGRWKVWFFHAGPPRKHRWKRCSVDFLKGLPSSTPRGLTVYGVSCQDAQVMASTIQYRANTAGNLRIPRNFVEARYGTNTLGFVTNTFHCHGRVSVRQGNPNPYGHESARCRTRFGDKFVYTFDQGS
jgi:hypothetical protein